MRDNGMRVLLLAILGALWAGAAGAAVLVEWNGAPPPMWVTLQGLDGGAIGLLPDGSANLPDPHARVIGPYDPSLPYLLVSRSAYATLQAGELPPAWQGALVTAGRPIPPAAELRAISSLAGDGAQVLILLPESLRAIADEPGCRAQRLRASAPVTRESAPPAPLRDQPPEYWQALAGAVNADRLWTDIEYLSTSLHTRYAYTTQMTQACQYVKDQFIALGLQASLDPFTYAGHALTNVVAIKPGTVDPTRIYLIGGHLDSTSPSPTTTAPGAEDNGSGAVAVVEAARLLAAIPTDYTIYFVCFSAEEQGLIGSEHFAAEADQQNLDIRGVLNFDMIAYYDPAGADLWLEGFHNGTSSVWLLNLVQQNAEAYTDLIVYQYPGEGWGSDHEPFHNHGFSAILAIENEWDSYPCYHRTCDTTDNLTTHLWRDILAANAISLGQLAGAQGAVGGITGTVTLSGGGSASGAHLRLEGTGYPDRVCGLSGRIDWPAILPGGYTLITDLNGYVSDTTQVTIASGIVAPVSIVLHSVGGSGIVEGAGARAIALEVSPAPVASGATIRLRLGLAASGRLAIYGPDGRRVRELQPRGTLAAGEHAYAWDGRDGAGRPAPAGAYWVRWDGAETAVARMTIVRTR